MIQVKNAQREGGVVEGYNKNINKKRKRMSEQGAYTTY